MRTPINFSIGAVVWVVFVVLRAPDPQANSWAHALLLFAALVLVPLALGLFAETGETGAPVRLLRIAGVLQLPAALALVAACWLEPGAIAAVAALPWVALTLVLAAVGFLRVKREKWRRSLDGLCADAALLFSAVGGAWTLADRDGYQPLNFRAEIVTLTAVHFHFAPGCEVTINSDGQAQVSHASGPGAMKMLHVSWQKSSGEFLTEAEWQVSQGWVSRCYGKRESAQVLTISFEAKGNVAWETRLSGADALDVYTKHMKTIT